MTYSAEWKERINHKYGYSFKLLLWTGTTWTMWCRCWVQISFLWRIVQVWAVSVSNWLHVVLTVINSSQQFCILHLSYAGKWRSENLSSFLSNWVIYLDMGDTSYPAFRSCYRRQPCVFASESWATQYVHQVCSLTNSVWWESWCITAGFGSQSRKTVVWTAILLVLTVILFVARRCYFYARWGNTGCLHADQKLRIPMVRVNLVTSLPLDSHNGRSI